MASDLCCVTLLPRPDRTGKLIAKVKRNKRVTSKRESLDIHETLTERYSREKERTNRRVLADPDEENGGRTSERGERKIDRNPRALEIDFLATSHSHRSDVFRPKFRSRFNSSIPDPRTPIPLHMLLLECLLSLLSSFRLQKSTRTRAYTRIKLTPRFCSSRSKSFNVIAKRSHHFPEKYANLRLEWSLVSTLGDPSTSCLKKKKRPRNFSETSLSTKSRRVLTSERRFFRSHLVPVCTRDFTGQVSTIRITTACCYEDREKHRTKKIRRFANPARNCDSIVVLEMLALTFRFRDAIRRIPRLLFSNHCIYVRTRDILAIRIVLANYNIIKYTYLYSC